MDADSPEPPFRAVVPVLRDVPAPPAVAHSGDVSEEGWSADDIEAAYLRALEAANGFDLPGDSVGLPADEDAKGNGEAQTDALRSDESPSPSGPVSPEASPLVTQALPAGDSDTSPDQPTSGGSRITPRQVVEAFLFVGGRPLTSRHLADVIGGSVTPEQVEQWIADLNAEYLRQRRPYEVRLTTGGYQLQLRPEFDKVRARVFGIGPREVRLAQSALEVLALVAYQQPISRAGIDAVGIDGAPALLRQLLRRQLISLERSEGDDEPTYRTTPRFLELFGLRSLTDLPRPELIGQR